MATQSPSKAIDLQKVITGAAKLEVKALLAGMECIQVWINQAARLSNIASDTLRAIQEDKGSFSETARRLTEFGKENAEVFGDLSSRLSKSYYDELGRLTAAIDSEAGKPARRNKAVRRSALSKKVARRSAARKKKSAAHA
jgi:methyl-accepting chemotaxis protein